MRTLVTTIVFVGFIVSTSAVFAEEKGRGAPEVNKPSTQEPRTGEVKDPPKESVTERRDPPPKRDD